MAEDDDGSSQDWDAPDSVFIEYQVDNGGFQTLLSVENDGSTFNSAPFIDTDFDGTGDGAEITSTFQTFTAPISETGSSLDFRIVFDLDSGDEDIAIDQLVITGDSSVIEPIAPLLNEFSPNPDGSDPANQTFELIGAPGEVFSGWIVSIEADVPGGVVDRASEVSGTFDSNGLLTVQTPDLENPAFTVVLSSAFNSTVGAALDDDEDGSINTPSDVFGEVFDAIGVPDEPSGDTLFGADLGGVDFAYTGEEPELIFRDSANGDLYAVNIAGTPGGSVFDTSATDVTGAIFDTDPTAVSDSFGSVNPTVTGTAAPSLVIVESDGSTTVSEEGETTDSFTVALSAQPDSNVTVRVSDDVDVSIVGAATNGVIELTFTPDDFATPQTVTVQAIDDDAVDGGDVAEIGFEVLQAGGPYDGLVVAPVQVDVIDNDVDLTPIYDIQSAGHVSPFVLGEGETVASFFATLPADTFSISGDMVATSGIVTAVDSNGFYLQDPTGDDDDATSDAIFVFTGSTPSVAVGDSLNVSGTVAEFFPGDTDTRNLPLTQLTSPAITTNSSGNALPDAVILGPDGRTPPTQDIDPDVFTSFDVTEDGVDFFESIEGMLVTAVDPVVVAGTNRFGEIFTVVDAEGATGLSERGALNISPDDFNPEKIQIDADFTLTPGDLPLVDAGAVLNDVTGVVTYSFGNFEIAPTQAVTVKTESELLAETAEIAGTQTKLTIASYNVLNLDPKVEDPSLTDDGADDVDDDEGDGRFAAIARQIVDNLGAPDVVALQEVQDNDGAELTTTTSASETLQTLIDAIVAAGGPEYSFIDNTFITDDLSGGQPGGNIRTAFLYNSDRTSVATDAFGNPQVQTIGSQASGQPFEGARLPLVATFEFNGQDVTVVNNHFSSKGGSAPIMGIEQDFAARQEELAVNGSLDERQAQSAAVQAFVDGVLDGDPRANVVVVGDLNEFEFVSPVKGFEDNTDLVNLTNSLAENERYSFIFQGNSQALDHLLIDGRNASNAAFDIVHTNSEFAVTDASASDHDPLIGAVEIIGGFGENETYSIQNSDRGLLVYGLTGQKSAGEALGSTPGEGAAATVYAVVDLEDADGQSLARVANLENIAPGATFATYGQLVKDDFEAARGDTFDGYVNAVTGVDTFVLTDNNDRFAGRSGDETVDGAGGNDILRGNLGDDVLSGGGGNDRLHGARGDDMLTGDDALSALPGAGLDETGEGNDRFFFRGQTNFGDDKVFNFDFRSATEESWDRLVFIFGEARGGTQRLRSIEELQAFSLRDDVSIAAEAGDLVIAIDTDNDGVFSDDSSVTLVGVIGREGVLSDGVDTDGDGFVDDFWGGAPTA